MPFKKPNLFSTIYLCLGLLILACLTVTAAFRQPDGSFKESGAPFIENFTNKDYGAQSENFAITQDHRGIIYIANRDGILEYNGSNWTLIPTKYESTVRALDVDQEGRVYVGAEGEFGFLQVDSTGSVRFHSLSANLMIFVPPAR